MFYFISFRDPDKNLNLGVCMVEAEHVTQAIPTTHEKGINPGGEALIFELEKPEEDLELNKLYTRQEMLDMGYVRT
jgi:hypothetical protein